VIEEARRTSFNLRAEQYDAVRPSYPTELADRLIARADAQRILEVGAGTGKATVVFARAGRELVAIEPGEQLVPVLRRNVAAFPNVTIAETKFEDFTGTGFDLVYAAQAFHWIDPVVRYQAAARALRPHGTLAVITNEKAPMNPEIRRDLDAAYARWYPGNPLPADQIAAATEQWTRESDASELFEPVHVETVPWTEVYTAHTYVQLLDTYSDHITLPDAQRLPLYEEIQAALERHGGTLEVPYVTLAFVARRR
jgi:SAM-dependent methyltransferase